ncbi:hypothetical protein G4B88_019927 [Cannabis sativa]|uniref:RING-type E3 ubiquitin transferase n=1 Tax=Cannabis sativa TaxID=3483 RepID=A0A7J6EBK8_CANSA|nr:hypothetical protein G4B88_019927 [Cannabis sativa]
MLGDTHLHTSVYVVTNKIIDYALRMWTSDFCCNLCVRVDINVLVYVLPEHNSDTEDDHVSENGAIDFVAASEDSINKLEKCLNENELLCNICFENVHNDVEARKLPCKQSYHGECIVKWLKTSKYCPLCRMEETVPLPSPLLVSQKLLLIYGYLDFGKEYDDRDGEHGVEKNS